MFLVYHPEGQDEPTRWLYDPLKLMSAEREELERRTGLRSFVKVHAGVLEGDSLCRRALLHMFLKRDHPKLRFEDVDFAWGELDIDLSRSELVEAREKAIKTMQGSELAAALQEIDEKLPTAYDDTGESGKAKLPTAE